MIKEYGERIGFKEARQKNQSEWVYDAAGGGSYIDAALYATGISDEQLMQNFCNRLHSKINETNCVKWPPRIDEVIANNKFVLAKQPLKLSNFSISS